MKLKRTINTLVIVLLAMPAVSSADFWSGQDLKIQMIDTQGPGTFVTLDKHASASCTGSTRLFISSATAGYKEILAMLLTAFAAQKNLSFLITQCKGEDSPFMRVQMYK
jgi:hypothetical protein